MEQIKIKSCFMGRFGRRPEGYVDITMEAVRAILVSRGADAIERIHVASYAPQTLCGIEDPLAEIERAIGNEFPHLTARIDGLFKTGAEALFAALQALSADRGHGDILVVGAEKMTHLEPAAVAGVLSARENPHDRTYGATLPALGGLVTRAYLESHGVPEEALDHVAAKNHRNGAANPNAHFRKTVGLKDVAQSPLVADPLRRLHCAPVSDGAAAVLLSRDSGTVRVSGWGRGQDRRFFQDREDITRFVATEEAARTAYAQAGVASGDIDVAEIHDAFSSFELINIEAMGFYPRGQSWHALVAGELNIGARLAVNPSGGMKARGHPIGASGLSSFVEVFDQLGGQAGARQHKGAEVAVVQSVGGVSDESFVFVLLGANG